jgi:ABC-type nickel/cobalt efflux system permease component RcnA
MEFMGFIKEAKVTFMGHVPALCKAWRNEVQTSGHTHAHTHAHTHTHAHAHTHTHKHTHKYTCIFYTQKHKDTHTHTHTHINHRVAEEAKFASCLTSVRTIASTGEVCLSFCICLRRIEDK